MVNTIKVRVRVREISIEVRRGRFSLGGEFMAAEWAAAILI